MSFWRRSQVLSRILDQAHCTAGVPLHTSAGTGAQASLGRPDLRFEAAGHDLHTVNTLICFDPHTLGLETCEVISPGQPNLSPEATGHGLHTPHVP